MANFFSEKYKKKASTELKEIINSPDLYVKEAIIAAKEELANRINDVSEINNPNEIVAEKDKANSSKKFIKKSKKSFRYTKSFLKFVRKPDSHRLQTSTKNRILFTLRLYLVGLLLLIIAIIPSLLIQELFAVEIPEQINYIPEYYTSKTDIFLTTLIISIIAGVMEETQFRLILGKFNATYFNVFIAINLGYIIFKFVGPYFVVNFEFYNSFLLQYIAYVILVSLSIFLVLRQKNDSLLWFKRNWIKVNTFLFYTLAFIFAILHLPTFDLSMKQLAFWPLIILPFLIYAFLFSYIRIRIGFIYAVLLHFIIDLAVLSLRNIV
ncbi:hypothetical protein GH721_18690 [Kriegella sp. EG-1]|nr:hypothetical protein [Flavobacteriaceae bacterium EG-1]